MTTILVHGTLATNASWYQTSWGEGGFLNGLSIGMQDAGGWEDIWTVNDTHVDDIPGLNGCFSWNGLPEGIYRGLAAVEFAEYLNRVSELTDEGIRIIAHSHGCNIVKLASSIDQLSPGVFIDKAVFLACPHFRQEQFSQDELSGLDRFDIGKVYQSYSPSDGYPYQLNPDRFGTILNVFSKQDKVQTDLAESLSGGRTALTGGFMDNVMKMLNDGLFEQPITSRTDPDPDAEYVYENVKVTVAQDCTGVRAHSVLHGMHMGLLAGLWLNSNLHIRDVLDTYGSPPPIPAHDDGA